MVDTSTQLRKQKGDLIHSNDGALDLSRSEADAQSERKNENGKEAGCGPSFVRLSNSSLQSSVHKRREDDHDKSGNHPPRSVAERFTFSQVVH
jgi:hypothetical protein